MSAFVCVLERSGGTVDPVDLDRLSEPLGIYGTQATTFCRGPVGIAVRHRGGPRSRHRHGPLENPGTGRVVAVAGRFAPVVGELRHNATEAAPSASEPAAFAAFAISRSTNQPIADDVGVLAGFLTGVSGAFVVVVANPSSGSIALARDHLGSSKIYYRLDRDRLIAASEPAAILRHGAASGDLDEGSIARFLGFRFGLTEQSYFREIRELLPAHILFVTANKARAERYWRFRSAPGGERTTEEITASFRERLARAIAHDVAGLEPARVALSLSGGLDSTAIAALAPRGVQAFSWTFDERSEVDERRRIELVSRHLDLPVQWVGGEGFHPLCDGFAESFVDENSPYLNPFSALKRRLYQAAKAAGCERVLVGDGGDALYAASEYWLRDSLADGKPQALWSLAGTFARTLRGNRFARRALGRALLFTRYPRPLRRHPAPWLTAAARRLLPEERRSPILPSKEHAARHELSVGVKHSELESEEQRLFARCGVERGNPFWSWPLLELTLHLSAHWYHRDTRSKVLTREALRGCLPEEILEGGRGGSLGKFFLRGLDLRGEELRGTVFRHPQSDWPRYVRREWVEPFLGRNQTIAFGHTILWRVIAYELWFRRLLQAGVGAGARSNQECRVVRDIHEGEGSDRVTGLVYGVSIRGRLPTSFQPYLRPAAEDRGEVVDPLEVSYRRIDKLPEVKEIWASEEGGVRSGDSAKSRRRFALVRRGQGFGLLVDDQGCGLFTCERGRIRIEWMAGGTGAAHYFFSYALPLWLEFRGVPVLHGSAVLMGGQAVGFIGPSGVGKSVLAAHLSRSGCGLLADDGLVLRRDPAGRWLTFSGPPLLRLWPSALGLLEIPAEELPRVHETLEKRQLGPPREWGGDVRESPTSGHPLGALYVLERQAARGSATISRVAPREALVRLIQHSVAAAPAAALGLSAQRFQRLADVAENVPVRSLGLPSGADSAVQVREAILKDLEGRESRG